MPRTRASTHELRSAIDCLPATTRQAMLDGIEANRIIVGAYADRAGGICPMLAAHRQGARTDFLPFARAWDGFTRAKRARRASEREVRVLVAHLQASLLAHEEADVDLGAAITEHRRLRARSAADRAATDRTAAARRRSTPQPAGHERPRPGDPDRSAELGHRRGWSWLRPFRHVDELDRAVAAAAAEPGPADREPAERELAGRR